MIAIKTYRFERNLLEFFVTMDGLKYSQKHKTLRLLKIYLLKTSFKAFAGKNLTFCDAAI